MSTPISPSSEVPATPHPAPDEPVRRRLKRRKGLSAMSDVDVWDEELQKIIVAERQTWRSPAYGHYNVALEQHFNALDERNKLVFRFDCKYDSPHHQSQFRDRLRTGDGTQNLLTTARACDQQRGILIPTDASDVSAKPNFFPEHS